MKKILILLLILVSIFSLSGCSETNVTYQIQEESMFVVIENSMDNGKIVYHKETKVMYAVSRGDVVGIFTLLVNPDGTPMLWEGK
jgi:hypothetical protein